MLRLLSLVPYILTVVVLVQAFIALRKEWEGYKSSELRLVALGALILGSALTLVSLYQDSRDKQDSRQEIKRLEAKADAATSAQVQNTLLYIGSFQKLNNELSDLKTQVKTDALQKQLKGVQADLEATQKALLPGPKAVLAFTFWPFYNPAPPQSPILATRARFPMNDDGSFHIDFSVVNLTDIDALDGQITLVICDVCKFAKEPPGFTKFNGQGDTERNQNFQRILAKTQLTDLTADIIAPANQNFTVGISYRCHTCIVPSDASEGTVLVSGDIPKPARKAQLPRGRNLN